MAVTIDEIEAFVSIARLGGFARAAEALSRSQPAISRRIEMLEAQLDAPIFERVRGGAVLTEAGRSFLPYAEAVLAGLRDGAEAVRGLARGERGAVSVALVGTLASTAFADMLRQFGRRHPHVKLELRTATSDEVSDLVRLGEVTLGLRYFTDDDPGLVSEVIMEEALVVACAPDHRLAGRRVRDPAALAGERWVAFPPRRRRREPFATALEQRLAAARLEPAEIVRIDSLTAQKRLVEAGFGIALLIESSVQEELRLGTLRIIDVPALRGGVPVTLVRRQNGYLSGAARTLAEVIRAGARRLRAPRAPRARRSASPPRTPGGASGARGPRRGAPPPDIPPTRSRRAAGAASSRRPGPAAGPRRRGGSRDPRPSGARESRRRGAPPRSSPSVRTSA
jgi:DNA-binding transcriptional LysR family regulator